MCPDAKLTYVWNLAAGQPHGHSKAIKMIRNGFLDGGQAGLELPGKKDVMSHGRFTETMKMAYVAILNSKAASHDYYGVPKG